VQNVASKTAIFYDYFKKNPDGTKKEVGRIWKNIIFPGIYYEYADTKEAAKTIKVVVKEKEEKKSAPAKSSRNVNEPFQDSKEGTYNMMDPSTAPKYGSASAGAKLKPIRKPLNFVVPQPKKSVAVGSGPAVLPNIASYPRNTKPIIIYECETSPECKKVREACTMLDLTVEYRPCPGRAGFSDSMVKTLN
jgi:hypothetical protein